MEKLYNNIILPDKWPPEYTHEQYRDKQPVPYLENPPEVIDVSVGRQLVILIPAAFLLSLSGNVDLIWWAFPIAEIVGLALAVSFAVTILKKRFGDSTATVISSIISPKRSANEENNEQI